MKINLNIEADSPDQLRSVLTKLLTGSEAPVVNVTNVKVTSNDPDRVVGKIVEESKAQQTAAPAPPPKQRAKKPEAPSPAAETKAPDEPKEEPKVETAPAPKPAAKKPEPKAEEPKVDGKAVPVTLPDDIKSAGSMRDLLTWLAGHGVGDVESMVATCESLKTDVPLLQKVPDISTRVRRAVEVLGLFTPVEPAE